MQSFAVLRGCFFEKAEVLDHHRSRALHFSELTTIIDFVSDWRAALAVELEGVLALRGGDALEAGEEVDVPEGAPQLAVGHRLQPGGLLQRDRFSDGTGLRPR